MRRIGLLAVAAAWPRQQAFGWGATGHEWATGIAIEKLPDEVPAFVRDPAMLPELTLMGRELDRSTGKTDRIFTAPIYLARRCHHKPQVNLNRP